MFKMFKKELGQWKNTLARCVPQSGQRLSGKPRRPGVVGRDGVTELSTSLSDVQAAVTGRCWIQTGVAICISLAGGVTPSPVLKS